MSGRSSFERAARLHPHFTPRDVVEKLLFSSSVEEDAVASADPCAGTGWILAVSTTDEVPA